MININNLQANIEETQILKGIDLEIKAGEVHAIMGPNGSGKSTLANVIAGRPEYSVTEGSVTFQDKELLDMEPEDRAREGVFLAFQYPTELPGVRAWQFLKAAADSIRVHNGEEEYSAREFDQKLKECVEQVAINPELVKRNINEGFSGGEKKRNEILQMTLLNPKLAILDETDSGLDIDALKIVADGVNNFRNKANAVLVVTHYQRLLNYIVPDKVHVLVDGKIVQSGGPELALELEAKGYDWVKGD
ncbi:MAG: Fe-S cluster assembly ATPase SufC [SAR202 cluster bacterium]|jgi:Fe-S cluster assembly ATP-binding protein|nr:Fe-S cluster assembly ATPase SufC [Chloroflexota bacterium]MQG17591.1 Fe-S cluster assembly ATPase SufC [SAR202 cluster bacterium]MQG26589.1 Fe-S cluster assembly ATPase SufC [SAR202 cluster bacterium]MQG36524.1 Fe-S cluster assembly ATPase SufC [SAR202 cluster bacterium]MQG52527.1 Fe-S cluster assembly ATPase SufC [SAR202 cluster bacterium]|tara:strand:+ start:14617 stop:15360 length:744 start_codon:yes stop_codon:yes gene_type:complete